jgi:hypothetical protein
MSSLFANDACIENYDELTRKQGDAYQSRFFFQQVVFHGRQDYFGALKVLKLLPLRAEPW